MVDYSSIMTNMNMMYTSCKNYLYITLVFSIKHFLSGILIVSRYFSHMKMLQNDTKFNLMFYSCI